MKCQVNGVNLYYEKAGTGPALLLLHGNGETHAIFDKAIPLLAEKFTVYALDSRGHGESDSISEYHYMDMAEDVRCFIEQQELHRPALYGFSDGGIIGLLLASNHPKLMSRLIVSGANTVPDGLHKGWDVLFRLMFTVSRDPKMKMMLSEPDITTEMLKKIESSVMVLAGSRDMIKKSHTRYIAENIQNSRLNILQDEGHGSYIVHSEKIAEIILRSLLPKSH